MIIIFFSLFLLLIPKGRSLSLALLLFFLFVPAVSSYDFIPALISAVSLILASKKLFSPSLVLLSLGVGWKLYPLIYLPLIIFLVETRRKKIFYLFLSLILILLPYLILTMAGGYSGLRQFLEFHLLRLIQWESLIATPYLISLVLNYLGNQPVSINFDFSYGPLDTSLVFSLTLICLILSCLVYRKFRNLTTRATREELFGFAGLLTLLIIIFGKVLSPQYLVWFIFLLPFVSARLYRLAFLPSLLAAVLTVVQFFFYPLPPHQFPAIFSLTLTLARNAVLVAVFLIYLGYHFDVLRYWRKSKTISV